MKVILTGGPGTGKTSVLKALEKLGYETYQEFARLVIQEEIAKSSRKVPWDDNLGFSELVLARMNDLNRSRIANSISFLDRGIPDLIAYMKFYDNEVPQHFYTSLQNANYHPQVFFFEPWKEIYITDGERKESFEEARAIGEFIQQTYQDLGFDLQCVSRDKIENRANQILLRTK